MSAVMDDPVVSDLSEYLAKLDTADKKAAFLESISWSEIINLAEIDIDEIIDSYYQGRKAEADRKMETAKEKAWERMQENAWLESQWDRYEERPY